MTHPFDLLDLTRWVNHRLEGGHATGIDRVSNAYVEHFAGRYRGVLQIGGTHRVAGLRETSRLVAELGKPQSRFARANSLARALRGSEHASAIRGKRYLNVGHSGFDSPRHGEWLRKNALEAIYFIHDLIPITHPQFTTARKVHRHAGRVFHALRNGTGIIVNSRSTHAALCAYAKSKRLVTPPVCIAPLGLAPTPVGRASEKPLPGREFVSIGTIEPRKNYAMLLQVWQRLISQFGEEAPCLTIFGKRGVRAREILCALDDDPVLASKVAVLHSAPDARIGEAMARSRALLFPSCAEGYGLPVAEALQAGVPVITSDLPSVRETGGDVPLYLGSDDVEGWTAAISNHCLRDDEYHRQRSLMARFNPPAWSSHFSTVEAWLTGLGGMADSTSEESGGDNAHSVQTPGANTVSRQVSAN